MFRRRNSLQSTGGRRFRLAGLPRNLASLRSEKRLGDARRGAFYESWPEPINRMPTVLPRRQTTLHGRVAHREVPERDGELQLTMLSARNETLSFRKTS